jgi:5'-AMP-activated protein kinase catalytic alpha subunit
MMSMSASSTMSTRPSSPKPACLNAFDIISLSPGFNLSGLFKDNVVKQEEESRFTSTQPASSIMSKLEEIASLFRFSFKKSKDCKVKLQGSEQGRKGHLCIDAEIFEVTPSLFVVELRKTGGIRWSTVSSAAKI